MKKILPLFLALVYTSFAFAQIPNAGFETWDSSAGYKVPVSWKTADSVTDLVGVLTCEQGSPGYSGNHYLKLTSKTIPSTSGAAAGIAVSGNIDFATYLPTSGFAYTGRPSSLTGVWQYASAALMDSGVIAIGLTKWSSSLNKRDTVGYADYKLPGSVTTWTPFSVPIYYLTGETPDTAIIYLASSGIDATNGSYLYIDTLAFAGSVPTGITTAKPINTVMTVYPSPNNGVFTVTVSSVSDEQVKVIISDMLGEKVKEINARTNCPVNVQLNEPPGVYFLNATSTYSNCSAQMLISK